MLWGCLPMSSPKKWHLPAYQFKTRLRCSPPIQKIPSLFYPMISHWYLCIPRWRLRKWGGSASPAGALRWEGECQVEEQSSNCEENVMIFLFGLGVGIYQHRFQIYTAIHKTDSPLLRALVLKLLGLLLAHNLLLKQGHLTPWVVSILLRTLLCLAMPWRSFVDGPECPNPADLGSDLEQVSSLRDRARRKERLVIDVEGKPEVRPTTANMKHNIDVLRPIVSNMASRNRVGSDPVEVLIIWCAKPSMRKTRLTIQKFNRLGC